MRLSYPSIRYILYFMINCLLLNTMISSVTMSADNAASSKPILTFDHQHGLLPDKAQPLLSIYADGKAVAVFPAYMKKAGTHTFQLQEKDLQKLKALISKPGIRQFDRQSVLQSVTENRQNQRLGSSLSYTSDNTTTIMNINIDQTQANSLNERGIESLEPLDKEIIFEDVIDTARNNPEIELLGDLLLLETEITAILEKTRN